MDSLYALAVKLSLSMGSLPSQVATGVRLFSGLESQMLKTAAASEKLNLAVRSMAMIGAGVFVASAGFGLLGFLDKAAQKAATLQNIMVSIQQLPGMTARQASALGGTATSVGMRTGLSQTQVLQVLDTAGHMGFAPGQLPGVAMPLAQFAMTQHLARGTSLTDATRVGTEFAHNFHAWTPQQLGPMLNLLGRALSITPGSGDQFYHQVSTFSSQTGGLYGKDPASQASWIRDSLVMQTLFSQMGIGSRAGTQYARTLQDLARTGRGGSVSAMRRIRSLTHDNFFNDKTGAFTGSEDLVAALSSPALLRMSPLARNNLIQAAFPGVAGRLVPLLSDPSIRDRLTTLHTAFGSTIDPKAYLNSPAGQRENLHNQLDTLVAKLGGPMMRLLQDLTPHLIKFADAIILFDQTHKGALDNLGTALIGFAALFTAGGAVMAILAGFKLITTIFGKLALVGPVLGVVADIVGTIAVITGAPIAGVVLAIAGIGVAIAGLIYVVTHFNQVLRLLGDAFGWVFNKVHAFLKSIDVPGLLKDAGRPTTGADNRAEIGNWLHQTFGIGGGGVAVHINGPLHVHGTDQHAARAVVDMIGQHLHDSLHHDSVVPHGLQPGLAGH